MEEEGKEGGPGSCKKKGEEGKRGCNQCSCERGGVEGHLPVVSMENRLLSFISFRFLPLLAKACIILC